LQVRAGSLPTRERELKPPTNWSEWATSASLPTRERELKLPLWVAARRRVEVAPHAGARI